MPRCLSSTCKVKHIVSQNTPHINIKATTFIRAQNCFQDRHRKIYISKNQPNPNSLSSDCKKSPPPRTLSNDV